MAQLKHQKLETATADNFTFFGKLVIIGVYFSRAIIHLGYIDLPLLSIFKNGLNHYIPFIIWQTVFLLSSIAVFLNWKPKRFLLLNGILIILALLMNELCYSNNILFAGCILITLSFSNKDANYVPIQLSILYFGAFIDKLVFEQWRSGDFMTALLSHNPILTNLSSLIDYHSIIMIMTYSTIVIELLLAILILVPKTRHFCILLGLFFHFSTIIFMHSFFGMFIVDVLISYFALVKTTIDFNEEFKLSKLINYYKSLKGCYKCKEQIWFQFELNDKTHDNFRALILSLLLNPFTAILLTIIFTSPFLFIKQSILFVIIAIVFIFAFGYRFKLPSKKLLRNE